MTDYFLDDASLGEFVKGLTRGSLYGCVVVDETTFYARLAPENVGRLALRVKPPVESLKGVLFPVRERVAVYPSAEATLPEAAPPQAVVGARACELRALEILDKVLLEGDFPDPFYEARRKSTVIVSVDCVEPDEFCFCNLVDGKPYPESGFDLNLSPVENGYLVEIGTDLGKELVLEHAALFREAESQQCSQRDHARAKTVERLEKANAEFQPARPLPEALADDSAAEKWSQLGSMCVECGACSFICPTCHCFLLYDQPIPGEENRNERIRTWDSCILAGYAKMAGVGGVKPTPRPRLNNRFENRIRHKFDWMFRNLNQIGCVGCGRCVHACAGGSDVRDVIRKLGEA